MSDNKIPIEIQNDTDETTCLSVQPCDGAVFPIEGGNYDPVLITGSITIDTDGLATEAKQDAEAVLIGAVNETAPGTDTASSGLNGRLQRIAQRLTSLITAIGSPFQAGGSIGNTSFGSTVADGANVVEGATTDAAVSTDTTGTISAKLRGLVKILASVLNSTSDFLFVKIATGTNVIGKVGIDQTTPGTTNRVDIGAALPAGTNAIGLVSNKILVPGSATSIRSAAAITGSYVATSSFTVTGGQGWVNFDFLFTGTPTNAGILVAYLQSSDDSFSTVCDIGFGQPATSLVADAVTTITGLTYVRPRTFEFSPIQIPYAATNPPLANTLRIPVYVIGGKEYRLYIRAASTSGVSAAGAGGTYPTVQINATLG